MQTSDASESHRRNALGRALTDANFTLRARAARAARHTSCDVHASHKNMGVSHDLFAQDRAPMCFIPFLNVFVGFCTKSEVIYTDYTTIK